MTADRTPPCRLFVLPAREAPLALILRRGPASWYHVIRWHTVKDTFEHGAWFRGRLYEERCDLSPDGQLFLYFALQGSRWQTSYKGAWTAISRAPWLHALGLWPQSHTWGGGGRFVGNRAAVLWTCDVPAHPDHPATGLAVACASAADYKAYAASVASREAEWSGQDQAGEPVFTRAGRLYRRRRGREIEIADFNALRPDPQPPPKAATLPLRPPRKAPGGRTSRAR